jgi:hypothetical protein
MASVPYLAIISDLGIVSYRPSYNVASVMYLALDVGGAGVHAAVSPAVSAATRRRTEDGGLAADRGLWHRLRWGGAS